MIRLVIRRWFGRTGNNIQQIANSLMIAELIGGSIEFSDHEWLPNSIITCNNNMRTTPTKRISSDFFFWDSQIAPLRDPSLVLPLNYVYQNTERVLKTYLYPILSGKIDRVSPIHPETIVIHLRGGDIFANHSADSIPVDYHQAPLIYLLKVLECYTKHMIISENPGSGIGNPVANYLLNNGYTNSSDGDPERDFLLLSQASSLALTGVGTYAIAACLLSPTNIYIEHPGIYNRFHINPLCLSQNKRVIRQWNLSGYLQRLGAWSNTESQRKIMLSWGIN